MQIKSVLVFLTIIFLHSINSYSQETELTGTITDKQTTELIIGARVVLVFPGDSTKNQIAVTDENGKFSITGFAPGNYVLNVDLFGYENPKKLLQLPFGKTELNFTLKDDSELIEAVTIEEKIIRVEQKGDTTQYNAEAFKTNKDATVEDLVTKMPGITSENGVIKAQGEQITKVFIDGEAFFGDDATAALKNLPAEIVAKIQVYDNASDQAKFTGISDGNEAKALNIVTKTGKNQGQFGKIYGGYGYPNDLYLAGANVNIFKGTKKISIIGMSNNVNQQNFTSEDILGATGTSASSQQQGGRGGAPTTDNFQVGQQTGVSTTHSIGVNYTDKWGTKTRVTGSYFFNASSTDNSQVTSRQYFISQSAGQIYNENYSSITKNYNHRANFKFDITLDSMNSLVIAPKLSYQGNDQKKITNAATQDSYGSLINQIISSTLADSKGLNASNSILWRHRFNKPKRTFSVNLTGSYNNKTGNSGLQSLSQYYDQVNGDSTGTINQSADNGTNGYSVNSRFSYTEPLGTTWSGEFFYVPSYTVTDADKRTYAFDSVSNTFASLDTILSNVFKNQTISNETGSNFRYQKNKLNFQVGLSYQNSMLLNNQDFPVDRNVQLNFNKILPNFRFKYDFSKSKGLMINYRAATKTPTIDQLQNVINNSNPLSLSSGNPNLKQQYNHRFFGRYNLTNSEKASNFMVFFSGELYSNYITNSSTIATADTVIDGDIVLLRGSQYRKPVNLNGAWNTKGSVSYGIPVTKLKVNLNFFAGGGYGVTPGLINNVVNQSQATNVNAGLTVASNISEKIDFTVSYTSNYNGVVNTRQNKSNNVYFVQNVNARFNWTIKERLVFNSTYSLNSYSGLSSGYNRMISLWNGGVGYKLLKQKQLEVRVSVFDILNNNNSITRNVTESYIEDVTSTVLNRYYMMTLTYTLRNFGTPPAKTERGFGGGQPPFGTPQ